MRRPERPPAAAACRRAPGDHGRAGARVSELAGTIWRWAAIAALVVVGAIATITLSFDDGEPAPAGLPAAQEGGGGGARSTCTEIERLLAAAALLPDDTCRGRRAANVAP